MWVCGVMQKGGAPMRDAWERNDSPGKREI
jgi:hypothetical protein